MNAKYRDAIKAGLLFGIGVAIVYLILGLVGVGVNHTPAMVSYMGQVAQYEKDMINQSHGPSYGVPYTYSHPMPKPPAEYYVATVLSLVIYAVLIIGFLATGAYAIKKGGQSKYSLNDTAYMGGLAGLGSLVPIFIAMVIGNVISIAVNGDYYTSLFGMLNMLPAGMASIVSVVAIAEVACCCLPIGILIAVVIAGIGAAGYVLLTNKIGQPAQPA